MSIETEKKRQRRESDCEKADISVENVRMAFGMLRSKLQDVSRAAESSRQRIVFNNSERARAAWALFKDRVCYGYKDDFNDAALTVTLGFLDLLPFVHPHYDGKVGTPHSVKVQASGADTICLHSRSSINIKVSTAWYSPRGFCLNVHPRVAYSVQQDRFAVRNVDCSENYKTLVENNPCPRDCSMRIVLVEVQTGVVYGNDSKGAFGPFNSFRSSTRSARIPDVTVLPDVDNAAFDMLTTGECVVRFSCCAPPSSNYVMVVYRLNSTYASSLPFGRAVTLPFRSLRCPDTSCDSTLMDYGRELFGYVQNASVDDESAIEVTERSAAALEHLLLLEKRWYEAQAASCCNLPTRAPRRCEQLYYLRDGDVSQVQIRMLCDDKARGCDVCQFATIHGVKVNDAYRELFAASPPHSQTSSGPSVNSKAPISLVGMIVFNSKMADAPRLFGGPIRMRVYLREVCLCDDRNSSTLEQLRHGRFQQIGDMVTHALSQETTRPSETPMVFMKGFHRTQSDGSKWEFPGVPSNVYSPLCPPDASEFMDSKELSTCRTSLSYTKDLRDTFLIWQDFHPVLSLRYRVKSRANLVQICVTPVNSWLRDTFPGLSWRSQPLSLV